MGHAGLVAHEGRQVHRLLRVILREGLDLTTVTRSALAGQEAKRAVTGVLELFMVSVLPPLGCSYTPCSET